MLSTLGWALAAGLVVYNQWEPPPLPVPTTVHPAVTVAAPPLHPPVRVVAEAPPPPPRPAPAPPKRPFAELVAPKRTFDTPLLMPRLAMQRLSLPGLLTPKLGAIRGLLARARPGEPLPVRLTAYCLRGRTRRGNNVRTGIIAADPRIFPLARHVELFSNGRYLGRYLVDDTGKHIKGRRIDIWTPDCDDARAFGARDGVAALVSVGR